MMRNIEITIEIKYCNYFPFDDNNTETSSKNNDVEEISICKIVLHQHYDSIINSDTYDATLNITRFWNFQQKRH